MDGEPGEVDRVTELFDRTFQIWAISSLGMFASIIVWNLLSPQRIDLAAEPWHFVMEVWGGTALVWFVALRFVAHRWRKKNAQLLDENDGSHH